jgi:hypothetical protein
MTMATSGRDASAVARDDSERSSRVAGRLCYAPGALNLKDAAVEDDHFAVRVGERAQTKISMPEDCLDAHLAIVDARDECAGGRDLKDGVDGLFEVPREGRDDNRRCTAPTSRLFVFEHAFQRRRNVN